jgi:MFS family permease
MDERAAADFPSRTPADAPVLDVRGNLAAPAEYPMSAVHEMPPDLVRQNLRNSVKDALAWSVMQGAGTNYLTPFIVLGGRGLMSIAAFTALPALCGAMVQVVAADVVDAIGRRNRIIVPVSLVQALVWLPICAAIFLPGAAGYWLMLACYALHIGLAHFPQPAWQSLMGDIVPPERRGRYFGMRGALSGVVLFSAFYGAGWWLTYSDTRPGLALFGLSSRNFGFLTLFLLACIFRLISVWYLARVYEPPYKRHASDHFTLLDFIRRAPQAHFGRFVFYNMLMNVGIGSLTPFLAWYLLERRGFSPGAYASIVTASLISNMAAQPLFGRLLDRVGSKSVMAIGGFAVVGIPVLLLFCTHFWHFVLMQVYEGVALAAFNIAVANYLFDVVTPPKRARCVAYNALFATLGNAIGCFTGAGLASWMPLPLVFAGISIREPFTVLLLGSAVLRLVPNLALLGTFEEFRLSRPVFAKPPPAPGARS